MKITDRFILNCMIHSAIWAWVTAIMYAAYRHQHLIPPSLFELIMVVGGGIFIIYFLLCNLLVIFLMYDLFKVFDDELKEKEKDIND